MCLVEVNRAIIKALLCTVTVLATGEEKKERKMKKSRPQPFRNSQSKGGGS